MGLPVESDLSEDEPRLTGERFEEHGRIWEWRKGSSFMREHWKNVPDYASGENLVLVFPPTVRTDTWCVNVADEEEHHIRGEEAGKRAFAIGASYVTQNRRPV